MALKEGYAKIVEEIRTKAQRCGRGPDSIRLVVVTKNQSVESIQEIYAAGCRDFGENRLQEALEKIPQLPQDIRLHFIGTLQRNKVAKTLPHFTLIHSVDDLELAKEISKRSLEQGRTSDILLQVNISGETTKHGYSSEEWEAALPELNKLSSIQIKGLMTIAPHVTNPEEWLICFQKLRDLRDQWRSKMAVPELFTELSMGMSADYPYAIEAGATLLRIGSAIFG